MVRLHWHVEAGQSAFIPPGGIRLDEAQRVRHLRVEMEARGRGGQRGARPLIGAEGQVAAAARGRPAAAAAGAAAQPPATGEPQPPPPPPSATAPPPTRQLAGQNETCPAIFSLPRDYLDAAALQPVGICLAHGRDADTWTSGLCASLADHFAAKVGLGGVHTCACARACVGGDGARRSRRPTAAAAAAAAAASPPACVGRLPPTLPLLLPCADVRGHPPPPSPSPPLPRQ